jgi:hypothetical protein
VKKFEGRGFRRDTENHTPEAYATRTHAVSDIGILAEFLRDAPGLALAPPLWSVAVFRDETKTNNSLLSG